MPTAVIIKLHPTDVLTMMRVKRLNFRTAILSGILFTIIPASLFFPVYSRCKESSFAVMPPAGLVPSNSRFIIEGFGNGQVKIESIKPGDAFLISRRGKIQLIPERLHIGQYLISQVILKPSEPLIKETLYTLSIHGIDQKDLRIRQNGRYTGWYSNGEIDIEKPSWSSPPELIGRKNITCGNDPAEWIQIRSDVSDEHNCFVLVHLKNNVENDFTRSYLLPIKKGMIYVGHGACSGPFNINSGYRYTAQLIPFDLAGNCNEKSALTLHFSDSAIP